MSWVEHQLRASGSDLSESHSRRRSSKRLRHRGRRARLPERSTSTDGGVVAEVVGVLEDQASPEDGLINGSSHLEDDRELAARALIPAVLDSVTTIVKDTVKAVTDLLGLTGNDPPPPTPTQTSSSTQSTQPPTTQPTSTPAPSTNNPPSQTNPATSTSQPPDETSSPSDPPGENGPGTGNENSPPPTATQVPDNSSGGVDDVPVEGSPGSSDDTDPGVDDDPTGNSGLDGHLSARPNLPNTPSAESQSSGGGAGDGAGGGDDWVQPTFSTVTDAEGRTTVLTFVPRPTGSPGNPEIPPSPMSPMGRIAVGTTVTLGFIAALAALFVLRRHKIQKREKKKTERRKWWFNKRRPSSRDYHDEKPEFPVVPRPVIIPEAEPSTTAWARRSSGAVITSLPAVPPMAEIRNGSHSSTILDRAPPSPYAAAAPSPTNNIEDPSRFSVGSLISFGSSSSNSNHGIIIEGSSINTGSDASHHHGSDLSRAQSHSSSVYQPPVGLPTASLESPSSFQQNFAFPAVQQPAGAMVDRTSAYSSQPRSPGLSRSFSSGSESQLERRLSSSTGSADSAVVSLELGFGPSSSNPNSPSTNVFYASPGFKYDDVPTHHVVGQSMSSTSTRPYSPPSLAPSPAPGVGHLGARAPPHLRLSAFTAYPSTVSSSRASSSYGPRSPISPASYGTNAEDRRPFSTATEERSDFEDYESTMYHDQQLQQQRRSSTFGLSSSPPLSPNPFADPDTPQPPHQSILSTPIDREQHHQQKEELGENDRVEERSEHQHDSRHQKDSGDDDASNVSIIASSCYGHFEEFETVCTPFIGTLSDELSLRRGDEVRVVKVYTDGWALVERSWQDSRARDDAERGLIPVQCLRDGMADAGLGSVATGGEYPRRVDSYTAAAGSFGRS